MELTFPSNKQVEFSFKIGIAGTSSAPQSVAVVLEKNFTALSYVAVEAGDGWKAIIDNPGKMFGEGEVKVSVNVVLNNRLFTPMKGVGLITASDEDIQVSVTTPHKEQLPVEEPAVELEQSEDEEIIVPEEPVAAFDAVETPKKKSSLATVHNALTKEDMKNIFKPITPSLKPSQVVKESVAVIPPMKMQLLKSIEPGTAKKVEKVVEAVKVPKAKESLFKLRKTKIVFK